jgi:hypothetical protein
MPREGHQSIYCRESPFFTVSSIHKKMFKNI